MLNVLLSRRENLDRQRSRVATSARIYFRVGTRSCCARAALCFPSKSAFSIPDYFCVSFLLHLSSSTSSSSSAKCNSNTCLCPQLKEAWFIRSTTLRQLLDHNSQFSASPPPRVWTMDLPSGANTPRARSRVFSASISTSTLARPGSERDLRDGASIANSEARSSVSIPKAFEGMLKTTTETGDIGMFSIKPSRVPPSGNTPRRITNYNEQALQRPHQSYQSYGIADDRRRLPSYARDTTSELISMYETPSQKSSRVFDDSDYRSFSMTQTSAYTLSNHRSYTSLRSQPEGNGLLQRPRSPFAYPTRLKRPGFRPSSPALTDGGAVDYRRRAEIDRMTYVRVLIAPGQHFS
jgi:hypothetical protein